jgi:hypothetical protein
MRGLIVAVVMAAALGAGVAMAQSTPPAPAPAAAESPAPSSPEPAAPAAGQNAQPQPSPTPAYRFVWVPTPSPDATAYPGPNAPEIKEIDLGDHVLVTPGELRVRVVTNKQVVSVIARTLGRELPIPRQDAGVFALEGSVPQVPRFLADKTYDVDFVAASADGRTAVVTLPLDLK